MAFLGLTIGSLIGANVLDSQGVREFHGITFIGTWLGLIGAAVCTLRGLVDAVAWLRRPDR